MRWIGAESESTPVLLLLLSSILRGLLGQLRGEGVIGERAHRSTRRLGYEGVAS